MDRSILLEPRRREPESSLPPPLLIPSWEQLEALPPAQTVAAGKTLQPADAMARQVYLIRQGVVKLKCLGGNGREMIVGLRSSGWLIGAEAVYAGRPAAAAAVTMTGCEVSVFPAADFLRAVADSPAFNHHFILNLCLGMQAYLSAHIELRTEPAQQRLEHFLRDMQNLAEATGGPRPPLSQVEMAQLLAITPEHLCRILGRKRKA